jgi:hypothetical protein
MTLIQYGIMTLGDNRAYKSRNNQIHCSHPIASSGLSHISSMTFSKSGPGRWYLFEQRRLRCPRTEPVLLRERTGGAGVTWILKAGYPFAGVHGGTGGSRPAFVKIAWRRLHGRGLLSCSWDSAGYLTIRKMRRKATNKGVQSMYV